MIGSALTNSAKKLGKGSFGEVWLAKNVTVLVAREVALKIPHDEEVDIDAIKQEAAIWLAASGHTNVLPFIEANVYEDYVVIVSEYAPDGSLHGWLKQYAGCAPSIEAAIEMTRGVLNGLAHLHARNIIHRDLKPDNVLLQGTTPRITDFGISRVFNSTSQSAVSAGTPVYMAPEAYDAKRNQQTDVWSVGVMMYQMLAGSLPFTGETYGEVMNAVFSKPPHPLPVSISDSLQHVVAKAMAKKPEARYKTATEMIAALQASAPVYPAPPKAVEPEQPYCEIIQTPLVNPPHKQNPVPQKTLPTPNAGTMPDHIVLPISYIENLNGVPLEMILVPAGEFTMGSKDYNREKPSHEVCVQGFYIGKYQITQKQWHAVMGHNPSHFKGDDLPVEKVSWHDAQAFCEKLRAKTRKAYRRKAYRLPSEAKWEYACRAGTTGDYVGTLDEIAWYDKNSEGKTHPVGQKKPNAFGLYDMYGNVREWCEDVWHDYYVDAPKNDSAWTSGGEQYYRVLRGGSWNYDGRYCRAAYRNWLAPDARVNHIGFRVVVAARTS